MRLKKKRLKIRNEEELQWAPLKHKWLYYKDYESQYATKVNNLEEIDKFLKIYNLQYWLGRIGRPNETDINKEIEAV